MKIGIVIDDWKIIIFDRRLKRAGFTYEKHPGVTADSLMLVVITDEKTKLAKVIKEANTEAYNTGKK